MNLFKHSISVFIFLLIIFNNSCNDKEQQINNNNIVLYRENTKRNGVYKTPELRKINSLKWKFKTNDAIWSSPVVFENIVYFGSDDNYFYAVDTNNGKLKWKYQTGDDIRSTAAIYNNKIYFTSYDGYLYSLDKDTGMEKWKFNILGDYSIISRPDFCDFMSSPLVYHGIIYVGCQNPKKPFYAINVETGNKRWIFKPGYAEYVTSTASIDNDILYFGGGIGNFYAVNIKNSKIQWKFNTPESVINYSSSIDNNGDIYFSCNDKNIYAISNTGELKWKSLIPGDNIAGRDASSPVVKGNLLYSANSNGHYLFAINTTSGELLWKFDIKGYGWSSPVYCGGLIYVGSGDSNIYAVDAEKGIEIWHFTTNGPIYSTPVIDNGVLYIGSSDGYLYALQ